MHRPLFIFCLILAGTICSLASGETEESSGEHQNSTCADNPCKNGGFCESRYQNNQSYYKCKCIPGYGGKNCTEDWRYDYDELEYVRSRSDHPSDVRKCIVLHNNETHDSWDHEEDVLPNYSSRGNYKTVKYACLCNDDMDGKKCEKFKSFCEDEFGINLCTGDETTCAVNSRGHEACQCAKPNFKNPPECTTPCEIGFFGPNCLKSCERGKFGFQCSQRCFCREGTTCDKVTGLCRTGCAEGFTGPTCSDSTFGKRTDDETFPMVMGGAAGVLVLIVIISLIVMCSMRKKPPKADGEALTAAFADASEAPK